MLTCAWCEKPATGEVVTSPARFGTIRGQRILRASEHRAPACDECRTRIQNGGGFKPSAARRGQIAGQTNLDEQLGSAA